MVARRILSEAVLAAACILAVGLGLSPPARGEEPERGAAPEGSRLVLRYRQPARAWTEALPIGNGRLGGMVFGGTASERIALNEDTVWAGERRDRTNPEALANLPTVRRLLLDGKPAEAEALAERTMIARPKRLPPYQPLGDLRIRMPGHESVDGYLRELDLDRAIARVTYRLGDAVFRREVFASAADMMNPAKSLWLRTNSSSQLR